MAKVLNKKPYYVASLSFNKKTYGYRIWKQTYKNGGNKMFSKEYFSRRVAHKIVKILNGVK
jgi:hypothetical protein